MKQKNRKGGKQMTDEFETMREEEAWDYGEAPVSNAVVMCGASAYEEKYYLNPLFERMPEEIRDELQVICVLFVEENSGIFTMEFNEDNELLFRTRAKDGDYNYDDIGAALTVREIEKNRRQLIESLELYYKVAILGLPLEDEEV